MPRLQWSCPWTLSMDDDEEWTIPSSIQRTDEHATLRENLTCWDSWSPVAVSSHWGSYLRTHWPPWTLGKLLRKKPPQYPYIKDRSEQDKGKKNLWTLNSKIKLKFHPVRLTQPSEGVWSVHPTLFLTWYLFCRPSATIRSPSKSKHLTYWSCEVSYMFLKKKKVTIYITYAFIVF